jgi:hypothetical protein
MRGSKVQNPAYSGLPGECKMFYVSISDTSVHSAISSGLLNTCDNLQSAVLLIINQSFLPPDFMGLPVNKCPFN